MKTIEVVAAIITQQENEKPVILTTQRGYGEFIGMWEFPGGKVEPLEQHEEALRREIREELEVEIEIKDKIHTVEYDYPNFHLTMHCYICSVRKGELILKEHQDAKFLHLEELECVNWLPADLEILHEIRKYFNSI